MQRPFWHRKWVVTLHSMGTKYQASQSRTRPTETWDEWDDRHLQCVAYYLPQAVSSSLASLQSSSPSHLQPASMQREPSAHRKCSELHVPPAVKIDSDVTSAVLLLIEVAAGHSRRVVLKCRFKNLDILKCLHDPPHIVKQVTMSDNDFMSVFWKKNKCAKHSHSTDNVTS